jgi:outer membrane biosynthesis protein TonB
MQAAAVPSVAAPQTRQQIFDSATAALESDDCAAAVAAFKKLETGSRKPSGEVLATILLRRGVCQVRLGQIEEGSAAVRQGLNVLAPLGAKYRVDIRDARLSLGRVAAERHDYATAQSELGQALAASEGIERIEPLLILSRVTMFDRGPEALAHVDEAMKLVEQRDANSKELKDMKAAVLTLRARALMNQGQFAQAYSQLRQALKLQGGLSLTVSLADVITRSDLALAALLTGDEVEARRYLAYTGAGRTEKAPFASAASMTLPVCGGDVGLRPQDRTVVEFRLAEDGSVSGSEPVYSTGGREAALEFARAVSTWSWKPEDAAAIPLLFRHATRVELRCSTVGERPSLYTVLETDVETWLASRSLRPFEETDSDARTLPLARAAVERDRGRGDDPARIPALLAVAKNSVAPAEERDAAAAEVLRLASATAAPPALRAYLALLSVSAQRTSWISPDDIRERLRQILADPQVAADPHSGGILRVMIAQRGYQERSAPADRAALLAAVVADARLPADDPVRIAALIEQASAAAEAGQLEAARAAFEQTGLSEQQCALVALQPAIKRSGASDSDFPMEALRWGFEGWTRIESDVLADGRTTNQRVVISYPPFVFNKSAEGIAKDMRYQSSYRPSGGAACSGSRQQILFRLPD